MAEQDRFGGWFGGNKDKLSTSSSPSLHIPDKVPRGPGAEQDRLAAHFQGKVPAAGEIYEGLPNPPSFSPSSGAEQDRYGSHFGGQQLAERASSAWHDVKDRLPHPGSGAEQDRYASHFSGKFPSAGEIAGKFPRGSGAEQDRYEHYFGGKVDALAREAKEAMPSFSGSSGAEQDRIGSHLEGVGDYAPGFRFPVNATGVGLLQGAILPSFGLQAGLSLVAYGVSRYTDRLEGKDWLWPSGMLANAWWSAIGTRVVYDNVSAPRAWSSLSYAEKLILGGVTAWGARLLYRIVSRSLERGEDDPRYEGVRRRTEPKQFWNKAFWGMFVPEAVCQTLIALPFTLPFRAGHESVLASPVFATVGAWNSDLIRGLGIFLFGTGFALECIADVQLDSHKKFSTSLNREGVWSIVRHPNYLGDALIHASFPLLLLSGGIMHPLAALGPIVNYIFLRVIGGDKENEATQEARYARDDPAKFREFQEYRQEKNSFWPALSEFSNSWTLTCVAIGGAGVMVERGLRSLF